MDQSSDDVSRLQGRYVLTLLSPSSRYFSLCLSMGMAALISWVIASYYAESQEYWRIAATLAVLGVTQLLDSRYIKNREYSKSLHSSAFGCSIWMISLVMGLVVSSITSRDASFFFVALGMFLLASFRISIYTTVLGCKIGRAWAICFIQPVALFAVMMPASEWGVALLDATTLAYGVAYLGCATAWSVLTDRSGRPDLSSTHVLVQAYIASQGGKQHEIESILEQNSSESPVETILLRFGGRFGLVLPGVHPGPYHPVGGSNIPYMIHKMLDSKFMVMHSISDHALNIPSHAQVQQYLRSLEAFDTVSRGATCTIPVVRLEGRARVTGLALGRCALMFMSLSPYGMEDLPGMIKSKVDGYARDAGFDDVLLVDCHNAMGPDISRQDHDDMLRAAKACLDDMATREQHEMDVGYGSMDVECPDVARGGLGLICIRIKQSRYYIGWADANNMENGVREQVVGAFTKTGRNLLEMCTSDTHYNPVKPKNRHGYYQFGLMSETEQICKWYLELARKADSAASRCSYDIMRSHTRMMLMGSRIFETYSRAMDRSMNLVKVFMIGCTALFLTTALL